MENIRIIMDFDTLIAVLKVWLSSLRYFILILQIAPFSVLSGPFYDIGSFERHDFRQLSRVYYFLRALSSRNYKTSVGKSSEFLKRARRLVFFGNDDCTFVIALHFRFRFPPPPSLLSAKFLSQVCRRSSTSALLSFLSIDST